MDTITSYFAQQGVLGIIIIMAVAVIVWQQKRIDAKDKQICDLQEKRKSDTDTYTQSYIQTTKEMVVAQRDSINTLNIFQKSIDAIASTLQLVLNGHK